MLGGSIPYITAFAFDIWVFLFCLASVGTDCWFSPLTKLFISTNVYLLVKHYPRWQKPNFTCLTMLQGNLFWLIFSSYPYFTFYLHFRLRNIQVSNKHTKGTKIEALKNRWSKNKLCCKYFSWDSSLGVLIYCLLQTLRYIFHSVI